MLKSKTLLGNLCTVQRTELGWSYGLSKQVVSNTIAKGHWYTTSLQFNYARPNSFFFGGIQIPFSSRPPLRMELENSFSPAMVSRTVNKTSSSCTVQQFLHLPLVHYHTSAHMRHTTLADEPFTPSIYYKHAANVYKHQANCRTL